MAEIPDPVTSREINAFLEQSGKNVGLFWSGLTDRRVEGHLEWQTSGKEASFTNWKKGEPNGKWTHEEDCAHLESPDWTWNDRDCRDSYLDALCQKGKP